VGAVQRKVAMRRFHLKILDKVNLIIKARRSNDGKTAAANSSDATECSAQDIDSPTVELDESSPSSLEKTADTAAAESQDTSTQPLSKYLTPSRQNSDSFVSSRILSSAPIEKLPAELFDQVMELLSMADKAALTYASSRLYQKTGGVHVRELSRPINWTAKLEFLDRLWTSLPNHKLCVDCIKYHLKTAVDPPSRVHISEGLKIDLMQATDRLFWGNQFLGQSSEPLGDWSRTYNWLSYFRDPTRDFDRPKMIVVTYEQPLTLALTHEAGLTALPSCNHSPERVQLREMGRDFIDGAPRPWELDRHTSEYRSDLYRCHRCPSEFQFSIKPLRDSHQAEVAGASHMLQLVHVTALGTCHTAHNRYWSALTSKVNSRIVSTDPFPLTSPKPLIHHALNWPEGRSDEYKVIALTH